MIFISTASKFLIVFNETKDFQMQYIIRIRLK